MLPVLSLRTRLSALQAASFLSIGITTPFFPLWLKSKALDTTTIGIILAIPVVARMLVTAPLTGLADRSLGPRRLLMMSHAGATLAYFALIGAAGAPAIAAIVALAAVAQAPVVSTNDLVTTTAVRDEPRLDYGKIRVWGSAAFVAASVIGGLLLDALGTDAVVGILAALSLICLFATITAVPKRLPSAPAPEGQLAATPSGRFPRSLWYVIGAAACTQASHAAVYAFGSLHWRALGFSDATIGWFWAIGVVTEVLLFLRLGRMVGRSSGFDLLVVGSAAAVIRFVGLAIEPGLIGTLALQALHGVSFGVTHLGTMAALSSLAPEAGRGRAQGTLGSMTALASAGATIVSGSIFVEAGSLVFAAMAPLGAAGFVLALVARQGSRRQPHSAGEGGCTRPPS